MAFVFTIMALNEKISLKVLLKNKIMRCTKMFSIEPNFIVLIAFLFVPFQLHFFMGKILLKKMKCVSHSTLCSSIWTETLFLQGFSEIMR